MAVARSLARSVLRRPGGLTDDLRLDPWTVGTGAALALLLTVGGTDLWFYLDGRIAADTALTLAVPPFLLVSAMAVVRHRLWNTPSALLLVGGTALSAVVLAAPLTGPPFLLLTVLAKLIIAAGVVAALRQGWRQQPAQSRGPRVWLELAVVSLSVAAVYLSAIDVPVTAGRVARVVGEPAASALMLIPALLLLVRLRPAPGPTLVCVGVAAIGLSTLVNSTATAADAADIARLVLIDLVAGGYAVAAGMLLASFPDLCQGHSSWLGDRSWLRSALLTATAGIAAGALSRHAVRWNGVVAPLLLTAAIALLGVQSWLLTPGLVARRSIRTGPRSRLLRPAELEVWMRGIEPAGTDTVEIGVVAVLATVTTTDLEATGRSGPADTDHAAAVEVEARLLDAVRAEVGGLSERGVRWTVARDPDRYLVVLARGGARPGRPAAPESPGPGVTVERTTPRSTPPALRAAGPPVRASDPPAAAPPPPARPISWSLLTQRLARALDRALAAPIEVAAPDPDETFLTRGEFLLGHCARTLRAGENGMAAVEDASWAARMATPGHPGEFDPARRQAIRRRAQLSGRLDHCLRTGGAGLSLVYEPLVNLGTGETVGVEALARWSPPGFGPVPPAEFIPLAERAGLMEQLGDWVLTTACRAGAAAGGDQMVGVNLSGPEIARPDLYGRVMRALDEAGLPPQRLALEITETVVDDVVDRAAAPLRALAGAGVHLVIDDFGSAASGLSRMIRLPWAAIKLDRWFMGELTALRSPQAALVRSVASLAAELGINTIVEGVEDVATLDLVRQLGCHVVQGFVWGVGRADLAAALAPQTPSDHPDPARTGYARPTPAEALLSRN